ncbi:TPA: hypothetical protein ACGSTA_004657 [Enterobacter cloacae]
MSQDYLARIAALEDALRQKDSQLSLIAETESFLRSALARAEEKIENEEREIEYLRAQLVSSALKVIRTVRVKKACTRYDSIVEASAPSRPIDRGIAGPGLQARVLTTKTANTSRYIASAKSLPVRAWI